ncbi:MAG: hypothetical protein J6T73_03455, partial [Clostridia bacterium]|nr:hypothetical protein [Clostridia bacterium]
KITLISGQNHIPVQNADSVPQYCFTLANNYMDSGLEAGETYSVQFELTSAATISSHAADVQFGQDEWTAIVPGANVRYDGAALQSMVVATADAGGGKTTYTLSMSVTLPKTGWTNSCRNILLSVYCGTNQQYTIDNIVITPKEKTVFGGHSLVLEDAIGVNFFVSKGDLSVEELTGSYVTFEIENSDTNKSVDIEDAFVSGNKYGFTCFLSSVQMAESVTPTFHAGTGETFSGSAYSVKNYIDYINANQVNYEENVVRLVNSIANYGYYAQHRFTSKTFTALASSYAKRSYNSDYYEYISGDIISSQLTTDGIDKGTGSDQFQYTLNFDSTTSIVIKFYTENVSFTEVTKGGADYTDWKNNYTGGDCTLYLLHLPISQLGERITVSGKVNGQDFTISVSGLSYIYNAIDSGTDATKNVSSALYEYYKDAYYYANNIPLDRDLSAVWI